MDTTETFKFLQSEIEKAKANNQSIDCYVRKQIELLEEAHKEFVARAQSEGYNMQDSRVGQIEVQQYAAMKQLAEEIGEPTEKYDQLIREVRIRIFGEENYKRFFETPQEPVSVPEQKSFSIDEI